MTELGQKLKEAREAKGLSIDQLHEITKIQKRHLVAIEEGNYDVLPGAFYARAFIKQYADAAGLNGEELLVEYQSTIPQSENRDVPQVSTGQKTQETMQKSSSLPMADHMPKILIALLVIAFGVVVWFVIQALTGKDDGRVPATQSEKIEVKKAENSPLDTKKDEAKAEEPKKEEPTGQQEVKVVGTSGKVSTLEIHNNKTLELEISAKGTSYVDVKDDAGNEILNTTVQSGQTEKRDLSTAKEVRLNIGNATNVEVKLNGQVVAYPLDPEKELHQRLVIKNQGVEQPAQ
ncbi:RodZ domain-containing protein [Bacillus sp. FSL M7-1020]|uniref:helix-turn-helix domain-containing protein n=1 Tax=Bacillus sp. FSL M7-1020 TaxID=2921540 RepID=UPI000778287C|nr:transcriptional regulator [Bacillus cereus]